MRVSPSLRSGHYKRAIVCRLRITFGCQPTSARMRSQFQPSKHPPNWHDPMGRRTQSNNRTQATPARHKSKLITISQEKKEEEGEERTGLARSCGQTHLPPLMRDWSALARLQGANLAKKDLSMFYWPA